MIDRRDLRTSPSGSTVIFRSTRTSPGISRSTRVFLQQSVGSPRAPSAASTLNALPEILLRGSELAADRRKARHSKLLQGREEWPCGCGCVEDATPAEDGGAGSGTQ